jgi:hypothetical protein
MSLLLNVSRIEYEKEQIPGRYDAKAQMWSTYAGVSRLSELPREFRSGNSTTSAGSEDDTGT